MLNKRISSVMFALAISLVAIMLIASIEVVGAVDPILSNSGGGNWQYYREITITEKSGNTLTDYQVLLQLSGNNFSTTKISDGADIRFTDINGNELSYWIEKLDYTGKSASIWVKVPSIPANGKSTIKMYYGNPSASTSSNVKTFIREIDGVVGSWHFDEGSGINAYDSSGKENNGILKNGPSYIDGKYRKALSFDGVDDYVSVSTPTSLDTGGTKTLTISAWVKRATPTSPILVTIYRSYGGYVLGVGIYGVGEPLPPYKIKMTKYSVMDIFLGHFPEDTKWHHLVGVWNNDGVSVYIDGKLNDKNEDTSDFKHSSTSLLIGGTEGQGYTEGIIDEVSIYRRALNDKEVLDLFNNYGYTTNNYPGKVLIRKYAFIEPIITLGNEKKLEFEQPTEATTEETIEPTVPNKPINLKATAGDNYINLRWDIPSDNGGSSITSYKIYRGSTSGKETYLAKIGNVLSYKDNAVTNDQTYYYTVSAINSKGEGAISHEVSAIITITTPTATTTVTPTAGPDAESENGKLLQLMSVILIISGLFFTAVTSIKKDVSIEFGVSERNLKYVGGTGVLLIIIGVYILLRCSNLI